MVASVAVVHCIREATGLGPAIKWPNDVLIRGKKVCGILTESQFRGEEPDYAIVGIGLNVNAAPAALPDWAYPATSLSAELGRRVPLAGLLRRLLQELEKLYLAEADPVFQEWRACLETLGRRVRIRGHDTAEEGVAEAVDEQGRLLLRHPDGSLSRIAAGDVTLG
jgi:BirA family biotin operon repressor/biotin-[acetyl-CoA-carboxylase] ligase